MEYREYIKASTKHHHTTYVYYNFRHIAHTNFVINYLGKLIFAEESILTVYMETLWVVNYVFGSNGKLIYVRLSINRCLLQRYGVYIVWDLPLLNSTL